MNAVQEINRLRKDAENIKNDDHAEVSLGIGDNLRQGDLYVVRVNAIPKSAKKRNSRQLADGDTQGSRHILEGKADLFDVDPDAVINGIRLADPGCDLRAYQIGPMFRCAEPVTITHPEHGDRTLTEPGCYAAVFQRSLTADEREERARD